MESSMQWYGNFSFQLGRISALRLLLLLVATLALSLFSAQEYQGVRQGATNLAANRYSFLSQNPIYQENQKPGATSWQSNELNRYSNQQIELASNSSNITASQLGGDTDKGGSTIPNAGWQMPKISGYASATSINHGDSIQLYVSTSQPSYNLQVYRMGWYAGAGSRLLLTIPNLPGQNQPVPKPQAGTGLIECHWSVSYTLKTSTSWVSGIYLVKLTTRAGSVAYIMFVLRNDGAAADILYQVSVTTYQAYNNWGGKSLYDYNSTNGRAYKVSYDRPYAAWSGAGAFFDSDYNMIRWLESHNYNVTYVTSLDTETNPNMYANRKVFLSDWHDEYWSKEMRDNLTAALAQGEHLAFFAANNIYTQIRFEPSSTGIANRVQVCYRVATLDPLSVSEPWLTTVNWRSPPVNEPENSLLGVMSESEFNYGTGFPWVVTNASHWIYDGTGLKDGDTIPGLVGYEYDRVYNNGLSPANLTVLSRSPVVVGSGRHSVANGTIYTATSGALVFDAGTMYWSWKLDDNSLQHHGADQRVQRMTANLLHAMLFGLNATGNNGVPVYSGNRWFNISLLVLAIALLAVLGLMVVRRIKHQATAQRSYYANVPRSEPSAIELLRLRYARGEIDTATFERMREVLEASSADDIQTKVESRET